MTSSSQLSFLSRQPFLFQSSQLPSPVELGFIYPNRESTGTFTSALSDMLRVPHRISSPPATSPVSPLATPPWTGDASPSRGVKRLRSVSPTGLERVQRPKPEPEDVHDNVTPRQAPSRHENEDSPVASDFVRKLYKMLEENTYPDIVSWSPKGDCFVIKELDAFTRTILPRMFKHSNFASFVRQLNKYDFHKVKNSDDSPFGEHSWVFRHPDFHTKGRDSLEHIKRKVPGHRKHGDRSTASPSPSHLAPASTLQVIQLQLEQMAQRQEVMSAHIRSLESDYESVVNEMVAFQRGLALQDGVMQSLVQYCLQCENEPSGVVRRQSTGSLLSLSPS